MNRIGRPKSVSRATLEEAASELFLERGYQQTSVDDIAARAGISRASFFNYFPQKADVLFVAVDEAIDSLSAQVSNGVGLADALTSVANSVDRQGVPLVATQADAMGAMEDALEAAPARMDRLRRALAPCIPDPVAQWAVAGGIAYGALTWATGPAGGSRLVNEIDRSLARLGDSLPGILDASRLD